MESLLNYVCPATCELCGQWMPEHNSACPRRGVHPSHWSYLKPIDFIQEEIYKETYQEEDE